MNNKAAIIDRIVLTVWIGSLWTVGLLVAPVLFQQLERVQAGTVAGALFAITAWVGMACAVYLGVTRWLRQGRRCDPVLVLILTMLLLTVIGHFMLAPAIAGLRELGEVDTAAFRRLHGLSSGLYLANCLMGLALVAKHRPLDSN